MTAFYRKSITPGSQPLRPSVRAGAPPLGRGGQTPNPPTDPKTGGARKGAARLADEVIGHYGVLQGAWFAVGASIARPRYNPPQLQHADANSYPVGFANLHRRVVLF
jgi:hypothetical protein